MGIEWSKCHFENPDDTVYCGKCVTLHPSSKEIFIFSSEIRKKIGEKHCHPKK